LIAGVLISLSAYFIFNIIWLTALGICLLILSFILIALGKSLPKLPPEVCSLLLETGLDNITALIEELGIKSRAIYLPSTLTGDQPRAFIPLKSNPAQPDITRVLPQRLITRYGAGPEDIGLLISTVGSMATKMLELKPGATAPELESALTTLFTGRLGIAESVKVITDHNYIRVEIGKPDIAYSSSWSSQCLGGPLASIVASITAEAWNKPTVIKQEEQSRGICRIELEIIG
jgi:hypothetical protein